MFAIIISFLMSVTQPAEPPAFRMCWKICPSGIGLCYTPCKLAPPDCLPCIDGCTDNVCNDEPIVDEDGLPVTASASMDAGVACRATEAGGECDNGYAWACDDAWCADTDGGQWRVTN